MNDYEDSYRFRQNDIARGLRMERMLMTADDMADYKEWLSENDGESYEGREPTDWREDYAQRTAHLPW